MVIWKFVAIGLAAALVASIGIRAVSAKGSPERASFRTAGPCDGQSSMQSALRSLDAAWDSLNRAIPDKGGHRAAAMHLIKSTINEVQAGCTAGGG